eukprot:7384068-Prymnesium_polylepis.1
MNCSLDCIIQVRSRRARAGRCPRLSPVTGAFHSPARIAPISPRWLPSTAPSRAQPRPAVANRAVPCASPRASPSARLCCSRRAHLLQASVVGAALPPPNPPHPPHLHHPLRGADGRRRRRRHRRPRRRRLRCRAAVSAAAVPSPVSPPPRRRWRGRPHHLPTARRPPRRP